MVAALLISLEGTRRLSFDADVLSLLPRDNRVIQTFRTFLARFGTLDQLYVVFTAPDNTLALEPVSNATDGFNLHARGIPNVGVCELEPEETMRGSITLRLEKVST